MTFTAFDKKIEISDVVINNYEYAVCPFNQNRFLYFIETSECNESYSIEQIKNIIEKAMNEEVDTYLSKENIVLHAKINGVI